MGFHDLNQDKRVLDMVYGSVDVANVRLTTSLYHKDADPGKYVGWPGLQMKMPMTKEGCASFRPLMTLLCDLVNEHGPTAVCQRLDSIRKDMKDGTSTTRQDGTAA